MTRGTDELHFYYDAQGKPAIVLFNGTAYGYMYNLQGDVIALVDGTGAKVVEYSYDARGKPTGEEREDIPAVKEVFEENHRIHGCRRKRLHSTLGCTSPVACRLQHCRAGTA